MNNEVMTKVTFFFLFLVLLASCTEKKEELGNGNGTGNISILARIENYGNSVTRTVVENNKKVHWEQSDRLGVYGMQSQNVLFTYSNSQGDGAEFTGQLGSKKEEPVFAYYPYREDTEKSGNSLTLVLPSEYEYTGGSNAPMIGLKNDGGEFVFKHVCGLMRITVNNLPDDAERFVITSSGANAPDIAGEAIVRDVTGNDAILVLDGEGSRSVTYRLGVLKNGSGFRSFFIPLPVGTYPELQVSLYGAGRTEPYFTRSITDMDVRRALMTEVPVIDAGTGADYVLGENTKIMSDAVSAEVVQSESDNTVLVYGAGVSASEVPQVGTIVLARASRTLPCGFLGRVTDVRKNGDGSHTVNTEKVALSEAFDQLYVDETVDLVPENTGGANTRGILGNIFHEGDLNLELGVNGSSLDGHGHYAKGSVGVKLALTVNINVDKEKKMDYGAFTLTGNVHTDVAIGVKYKGEKEAKLVETELGELRFGSIPVAGGLILLFPTYAPHFTVKASGEIENTIGLENEFQFVVGAEFRDGKWRTGAREMPQANAESPWNFQGHLTFSGSLSAGLNNSINLKLYNRNDMKASFEPEIGYELAGEIDINGVNEDLLAETLDKTTFSSCLYLQGNIKVDASLLAPGVKGELSVGRLEFLKKEIRLLPIFEKLQVKVEQVGGNFYKSNISTELRGELLYKDAGVELVIVDREGNEISSSEPISYNGGNTFVEEPNVVVPLENEFSQLKADTEYEVYPRVVSPIFTDIVKDGVIDLKRKSISFDTHNSIRDVLTKIYNENGGKNWEHQNNWCSDAPIAEWEGIDYMENGTYKFSFFKTNNLTGTVVIENSNAPIILCESKFLTGLRLVNCPNLKIENGISQYANLKQLYIDNINIYDEATTKNDDGSLNEKYTFKISSMSFLESIEIKNCIGKLFYLSVVNCPNLTSFICEDLVFNELFYNEETYPIAYWKTTSLNIHLCKRLNVIRCNRLSNVGEVNLENCQSLEEVSFGECNFKELNVYGNFEAKNFMVDKTNRYIDNYMIMSKICLFDDRKNSLKFGNLYMKNVICKTNSWESLEIDSVYFDSCVLEVGSLAIKGEPYSDVFNFNKCLKSAIFDYCHFNQNIIFEGCDKLERLSCTRSYTAALTSDYSVIDVRNTPNLKYLNCSGSDFYDILFDSHLNFVEVHCLDMRNLLKMIPDFLNPDAMVCFKYDVRYSYRKVHNQMTHEDEIEVTDRGYGWWYPGEPESGRHER